MIHIRLPIAVIALCVLTLRTFAASERDIGWLRGKCPEGAAMIHQYGGSGYSSESDLYLYEVASGSKTKIGRGCQPEFSPDGNLIAWIEGSSAKGCSRRNTSQKHTIATGVDKSAGVHWVSNTEVVVVISSKWYRVDVGTGDKTEVPTLKRLGTGGTEIDVKYRGSDNWSYVAGTTWKYVNGSGSVQSGSTGGHCSPSLSPDGKSCTGLKDGHDECKLTGFISGGTSGTLRRTLSDCSSKGFDNQRWSSNDPRFIVAQYECNNKFGVWEVGSNDVYLFGSCTSESYGDFTRGAGTGDWPAGQPQDPEMLCDVSSQSFSYTIGQTAPSAKTLKVYTEAGTLESVSKSSTPSWLTVSLSATSGNEITVTNSVDVSGLSANTYTATVTISSSNAGNISYTVTLTVNEYVAPPAVTLTAPNGGETFFVGQTMTITWEANEDSLTRVEIFISPNEGENWYAITGTSSINSTDPGWESYDWTVTETLEGASLLSTTVLVMVQDYDEGTGIRDISESVFAIKQPGAMELKLNLGGSELAVTGWENAAAYANGGADYDFATSFSTSGLTAPAPADVYRTCRHRVKGAETGYSIVLPNVPDGHYTFRFHFADAYGDRSIDVSVNGASVIENLDIVTESGGTGNALVIEENLSITGGSGVTVTIDDDRSNPADVFMSGLEVLSVTAPTLTATGAHPRLDQAVSIGRGAGSIILRVADVKGARDIAISDLNGRIVRRIRANGGTRYVIGTAELAPGMYTVSATVAGRTHCERFSTAR